MSALDWIVLFGTLLLIVGYGTWKTRGQDSMQGYLLGNNTLPWWGVGLSIMATQASAITFLSTTGQAYEDGMRFLQFYFGLPLAMIILSITAVPLYHRLKVYTAYEYLESRFDRKTRTLAAFYFLMLRGLSVGITIYAPALILSTMLGWKINLTTIMIGTLVMVYTVSGGTKAVSITQKYQLTIIMAGMVAAGLIAFSRLPEGITFSQTFQYAGEVGKLNLINLNFNLSDRYNIWSGLIGGLFLFLSYFGADQSQVGRYLGGASITESRLGLLFNGLLKIPMQFVILYIGILIFVFYQFQQAPIYHNQAVLERATMDGGKKEFSNLQATYDTIFSGRKEASMKMMTAIRENNSTDIEAARRDLTALRKSEDSVRISVREVISRNTGIAFSKTRDTDYVFINFVMTYLPHGLIGLLLAIVFSAAMSSTASELNALASTTVVDIYKRSVNPGKDEGHYVSSARWFTVMWALVAMAFASLASQAENLIQYVNIVGSLFYGTILGIFLSAFYLKYLKSTAVFIGALVGEAIILYLYFNTEVAFLLYNIIGCVAVIVVAFVIQAISSSSSAAK